MDDQEGESPSLGSNPGMGDKELGLVSDRGMVAFSTLALGTVGYSRARIWPDDDLVAGRSPS